MAYFVSKKKNFPAKPPTSYIYIHLAIHFNKMFKLNIWECFTWVRRLWFAKANGSKYVYSGHVLLLLLLLLFLRIFCSDTVNQAQTNAFIMTYKIKKSMIYAGFSVWQSISLKTCEISNSLTLSLLRRKLYSAINKRLSVDKRLSYNETSKLRSILIWEWWLSIAIALNTTQCLHKIISEQQWNRKGPNQMFTDYSWNFRYEMRTSFQYFKEQSIPFNKYFRFNLIRITLRNHFHLNRSVEILSCTFWTDWFDNTFIVTHQIQIGKLGFCPGYEKATNHIFKCF